MSDRTTPRPRLSRFLFRVRTLLLIVLVIAVPLGMAVNRARTQAKAVAAVKAYGGFVRYDHDYVSGTYTPGRQPHGPRWLRAAIGDDFFRTAVEVNPIFDGGGRAQVRTERTDDAVIPSLRGLPGLKTLIIHQGQATDRTMEIVGRLQFLEELHIPEAPTLTEAGFAHLASLRRLKELSIAQTPVTDAGFAHLSGLRSLKKLYVWSNCDTVNPCVTDAGLKHLGELTNLEELTVFNGEFTDAGLAAVARLTKLKSLRLTFGNYHFTPKGLAQLMSLQSLTELDLQGQGLPSAGLEHLAALPKLTRLLLALKSPLLENGPKVRESVERLARLRPDLSIQ